LLARQRRFVEQHMRFVGQQRRQRWFVGEAERQRRFVGQQRRQRRFVGEAEEVC
jgi:hypothetical protein